MRRLVRILERLGITYAEDVVDYPVIAIIDGDAFDSFKAAAVARVAVRASAPVPERLERDGALFTQQRPKGAQ
jgi:hypothetical protein